MIVSCSETPGEVTTISFNPEDKPRSIFETGIIKGVELVKLESEGCVVGNIDKIICNDSLLYILDSDVAKEVYVFTREGKLVNKISRHGHGQFEYTQLWDIFFDKGRNALCLLSRYDQKIISFTPDGGRILGEIKLPKMFGHIVPIGDSYIGYMDNYSQNPNMPYNIWTMDKSFNLLEGFLRIDPQLECSGYGDVNTLSSYEDTIFFKPECVNTIYQIKDGKVAERYKLDFGKKTFPENYTVFRKNRGKWLDLISEKVVNIFNYTETDDYLLMDFLMDEQFCLGIYNKQTHTSEIARLDSYKDKYLFPFGRIKSINQFAIYSEINYEDLYEVWKGHNEYVNFEDKYPKQVDNIRKLFPKLEGNGNPFIAIYSLK